MVWQHHCINIQNVSYPTTTTILMCPTGPKQWWCINDERGAQDADMSEPQVCFSFFFALLTIFTIGLPVQNHHDNNDKCPPTPTPGRMGLETHHILSLKYVFFLLISYFPNNCYLQILHTTIIAPYNSTKGLKQCLSIIWALGAFSFLSTNWPLFFLY